jgi:hypothetical protein
MIKAFIKISLFAILIIGFNSCVSFQQNSLFTKSSMAPKPDTTFYVSSEIYNDILTSEGWFTKQAECITVETSEEAAYSGDMGLIIKWDRQVAGCPWLGMGFGWDGWNGKDLTEIKNTAALQFWVKLPAGEKAVLPFAIGLEAYDGSQAWLGMSENVVAADKITTEWTKIVFPLSEFNWFEQDADISTIKQIIFNFEGNGEIYLDEIKIAPYYGGFRKRAYLTQIPPGEFKVDGEKDDLIWTLPDIEIGDNTVHLAQIDSFLCIALEVIDNTPLTNYKFGDEIYNGDAFEIAFASKINANNRRTNYLTTDRHIGFSMGDEIIVWDWKKHQRLTRGIAIAQKTSSGYIFEAMINLNELGADAFKLNELYGLEMAVDLGDSNGRKEQIIWNNPSNSGFTNNPSLWGEMLVIPYIRSAIEVKEINVMDIE